MTVQSVPSALVAGYSTQLDRIQQRLEILHRATLYDAGCGREGYYAEFIADLRQEIGAVRDGMRQALYSVPLVDAKNQPTTNDRPLTVNP